MAASQKFKDTLTDRKRVVFLTPMNIADLKIFKNENITHRLLHGGLPSFFLSEEFPEKSFQEWTDSFWSKDIDELYKIDKKFAFLKFFELLALQSGGLFEAKSLASPCGVSHTTIANYLNVMSQTHIAYIIRPYHKNLSREIVAAPKIYFFDTGFISYFREINKIDRTQMGFYWEHLVLNELLSFVEREQIHFWRNKQKHEVDFIVKLRGHDPIAIECKLNSKEFNPANLLQFRKAHPDGVNYVVSHDITFEKVKAIQGLKVHMISIANLNKIFS